MAICAVVEHLNNPKVTLPAAEAGAKIVADVRAEVKNIPGIPLIHPSTALHVDEIVVGREYRRLGVARTHMAEIEKVAQKKGISQVTLNVWEFNDSAKALYEELGYAVQRSIMKKDLR